MKNIMADPIIYDVEYFGGIMSVLEIGFGSSDMIAVNPAFSPDPYMLTDASTEYDTTPEASFDPQSFILRKE